MSFDIDVLASSTPNNDGIVQVPTAMLEEYFNISRKTLAEWERKGCPKLARGKWDFIAVIRWKGGLDPLDITDEESSKSLVSKKLKAEIFLKEQQGQLAEIELQRTRGEMIDVEDAKKAFGKVIATAKTLFLSLPPKVAPRLLSLSVLDDLRSVLEEHQDALVKAKTKTAVSKIIAAIVEDITQVHSVQEINNMMSRLVHEILEELSAMGVGISTEADDE